jgi:hypothetical protein
MKMNDSKTEAIQLGNKTLLKKSTTSAIRVGEENIELQNSMKYLGVELDKSLDLKDFIKSKCRKAAMNLRLIGKIRIHLNKNNTEQLVNSLVTSVLDYNNAILCGLPEKSLNILQRIQNWAAKLVLKRRKYDSSTDSLMTLHWLPIKRRVQFKVCCIMHRCTYSETSPAYLRALVKRKVPTRTLRSNRNVEYELPKVNKKTHGGRAFTFMGPKLWNVLPADVQNTKDFKHFKKLLKTYFFNLAFY